MEECDVDRYRGTWHDDAVQEEDRTFQFLRRESCKEKANFESKTEELTAERKREKKRDRDRDRAYVRVYVHAHLCVLVRMFQCVREYLTRVQHDPMHTCLNACVQLCMRERKFYSDP